MEDLFSVSPTLSHILTYSDRYLNCPTHSPSTPAHTIHIDLPEPPPLLPALIASGAKQEVAQAMQMAYHERACEFREQAVAVISRACSKLAQIPSTRSHTSNETIIAAFKHIYLKKLNAWISEGVALLQEKGPSVLHCRGSNETAPLKLCKAFNHQYVPLLEHFFEENHFPSHSDKVFLAQKSNMTYRQIHVWFQNRRNRSRNSLHKKLASDGNKVPLEKINCGMREFTAPKSNGPPSSQSIPSPCVRPCNVLDGVAPAHGFPAKYPPKCTYHPFPSVPVFATPEWRRRPALSSEHSHQFVVDVDQLTTQFSRMNLWDDTYSRSRRKAGKMAGGSAATSAITIKPSPAPHPACIRTTFVASAPPRITLQRIPASASPLHGFRTPGPDLPMATLVPTSASRRKIVSLPKRTPFRPLDRGTFKCWTSSPILTSSSRSSSLGSEVSMQDNTFSCNWSSGSSSISTTPETPPSPLPHPT